MISLFEILYGSIIVDELEVCKRKIGDTAVLFQVPPFLLNQPQ